MNEPTPAQRAAEKIQKNGYCHNETCDECAAINTLIIEAEYSDAMAIVAAAKAYVEADRKVEELRQFGTQVKREIAATEWWIKHDALRAAVQGEKSDGWNQTKSGYRGRFGDY